ncbi:hypothetical protein MMC30_000902 [Trapelia coarctata]|nr:hypothetical protein [Trapelia coarctata]
MAAQAAMVAETIAGMKRVIHGRQDSTDSDDSDVRATNRGQKLKRKAHFVHEGHLSGGKVYKRKIEHAGYHRYIISQNPRRYDEYGDELEDDEEDERADAEAAEENPYNDVRLEELFMPLTAASELPNHPSFSIPYKSKVLTNMVQQTCEMIHKERKTLSDMKHLLVKFRGDASWIPGECIVSEDDAELFAIPKLHNGPLVPRISQQTNGNTSMTNNHTAGEYTMNSEKDARLLQETQEITSQPGHEATNIAPNPDSSASGHIGQSGTGLQALGETGPDSAPNPGVNEDGPPSANASATITNISLAGDGTVSSIVDVRDVPTPPAEGTDGDEILATGTTASSGAGPVNEDDQMEDVQVSAHRMTTRAQAQAVSDKTRSSHTRSPTPDGSNPPYIHPLFIVPQSALPDRDFGLPANEAEETRRILMMWVQKQEEVVRGVERLYEGLLKADRMRKTVYKWCKADGHVGEMSDGEDWYDKEEWGLDEDLKKGQLEEEDDTVIQGKKTRGRRTAQ